MAKRSGFQYRAPRSKMPKLDITISSSQHISVAGPSHMISNADRVTAQIERNFPAQSEDMWGDDDDEEMIMLASQACEKVEANHEMVISQAMNPCQRDSDISYGVFRREVQASTQLRNHVADNFMDEDEDIFTSVDLNLLVKETAAKSSSTKENSSRELNAFAVPGNVPPRIDQAKKLEKNRNDTQQYMTDKIKTQKREIENLRESLAKLQEKCQTKEGEASTLRYELAENREQCERIRRDKMAEVNQLEKDFSEKIVTLEKAIETQRAVIEFKNIEILNKKSRKSLNDTISHERESLPDFLSHNLFKMPIKTFPRDSANPTIVNYLVAHSSEPPKTSNERDVAILNNLHALQAIYTSANHTKQYKLDDKTKTQISTQVSELMFVLRSHVDRLEVPPQNRFNPLFEYQRISSSFAGLSVSNNNSTNGVSGVSIRQSSVVNQEKPMIFGEKLIYERQMLAVIALFCENFHGFATSILSDKIEQLQLPAENPNNENEMETTVRDQTFVDMLADVLTIIGFSTSHESYGGLVEAASIFACALAKSYSPSETNDASLLNLFKSIVFCQPNLASLEHLSEFLETVSKSSRLCNKLCNNEKNNIACYPRYNVKKFTIDTCPLQIYASLLETAFELYDKNESPKNLFYSLTNILVRLIGFLRNCLKFPVDWVFRRTDNENAEEMDICHCWCRMIASTIILLHLFIKTWIQDSQCIEVKRTEIIFKMGALFLHENFHKFYETKVLQLGGFPVKNRLQAIYDWIDQYNYLFAFHDSHSKAIQTVNLRRISLLNEPQRMLVEPNIRSQGDNQDENVCPFLTTIFDTFVI